MNKINIRVGNDIVFIKRFEKSLEVGNFTVRIFHEQEISYCEAKADKVSSLAARYAAKEAFAKALGTGLFAQGITFQDVWVTNEDSGRPMLNFSEKMQNILKEKNIVGWDVSLSHHGDYALATVILC